MQDEGYSEFKIQNHTQLWQSERAKNPKLGFGSTVFDSDWWGWNEKWVAHVREHCAEYAERYGKREKQS